MRTYCKRVDITSAKTIHPWVVDCVMRHKTRYDFRSLFLSHGMTKEAYEEYLETRNTELLEVPIWNICFDACIQIKNKALNIPPVRIRTMMDRTTGKMRQIGKESAMQQVFDYIAVHSAMDIFTSRLVVEQASSIPGRGQVYGKNKIKKWIDDDNSAKRYAERHGYRYTRKCQYHCKLDIEKCYPSANTDIFLELFSKDCGNPDIMWLWTELIRSHRVGDYTGFMIGALPSQWACQYMVSYIYRFAKSQGRSRRGKHIKAVNHMMIFMDDMLIIGSNRAQIKKAIERTISYTREQLGWTIKPEWHIRDIDQVPIDMMGYVIHADGSVTVRARDFVRVRRMFLRCHDEMAYSQAVRIMSQKGFLTNSDSRNTIRKYDSNQIWKNASRIISDHDKEVTRHGHCKDSLRSDKAKRNRLQKADRWVC